jgi:hypothetical protein
MGFGFAKSFIIFLIIAVAFSIWTKNAMNGVVLMGIYAVIKIIWGILTAPKQRM